MFCFITNIIYKRKLLLTNIKLSINFIFDEESINPLLLKREKASHGLNGEIPSLNREEE